MLLNSTDSRFISGELMNSSILLKILAFLSRRRSRIACQYAEPVQCRDCQRCKPVVACQSLHVPGRTEKVANQVFYRARKEGRN
jgi:hypothetical protein